MSIVLVSESLNLVEPSVLVQACREIALPLRCDEIGVKIHELLALELVTHE